MTILLILFVLVVLVGASFLRRGNVTSVALSEIPNIFEKVKAAGKDAAFATLCFGPLDKPVEGNSVNVQFSIEDGRIGFDWCLLAPGNIQDKGGFLDLAKRLRRTVTEHKAKNGCEYLRVEDGDLVQLCRASICELYGLPETATVDLVWEGFAWP